MGGICSGLGHSRFTGGAREAAGLTQEGLVLADRARRARTKTIDGVEFTLQTELQAGIDGCRLDIEGGHSRWARHAGGHLRGRGIASLGAWRARVFAVRPVFPSNARECCIQIHTNEPGPSETSVTRAQPTSSCVGAARIEITATIRGGTLVDVRAGHTASQIATVADTCERTGCIGAHSVGGARIGGALVDVRTRDARAGVSSPARARERADSVRTVCVRMTAPVFHETFVGLQYFSRKEKKK